MPGFTGNIPEILRESVSPSPPEPARTGLCRSAPRSGGEGRPSFGKGLMGADDELADDEEDDQQHDAEGDAALDQLEFRLVHRLIFHLLNFFMEFHVFVICHDATPYERYARRPKEESCRGRTPTK